MDRNTVMHNGLVLTLFDPMTHTPARYVTFLTDYWLLVCLSGFSIVNLDLVIMGWKDSRISWNATSAPWSAHRWNCVSFWLWLTQFKVSENLKLTQMHRKRWHYHLSPQSHGSSTCLTFFRLALRYSALSLDFYHILISVIAPPPTNTTINWLCLLHLFVWCFQQCSGIMCTYPTN